MASLGVGTTLLVDTYDDTYDVTEGVRTAVEVAGTSLGGVRLDSGDLVVQASEVREQLDALGATETKIVVTSDLDEYAIAALAAEITPRGDAPIPQARFDAALFAWVGGPVKSSLVGNYSSRAAGGAANTSATWNSGWCDRLRPGRRISTSCSNGRSWCACASSTQRRVRASSSASRQPKARTSRRSSRPASTSSARS